MKIISAYRAMPAYIAAARADPTADLSSLWQKYVIRQYCSQLTAGEHTTEWSRAGIRPIRDLDRLEEECQALSASGVEDIVAGAYNILSPLLPYHKGSPSICIMPADPQDLGLIERLHGVLGTCLGPNTLLTINPAGRDWQRWVLYVLAHQRHHSAWSYHYYYLEHNIRQDLLVSLVSEGAADSFASLVCPDMHPTWVEALSIEEEARLWQSMRALLNRPDPDGDLHRSFFFGNPQEGIPSSTGYTIGYHTVESYRKNHPEASVADWTTQDPEVILIESGYAPNGIRGRGK